MDANTNGATAFMFALPLNSASDGIRTLEFAGVRQNYFQRKPNRRDYGESSDRSRRFSV
jgi:hypothetical protein